MAMASSAVSQAVEADLDLKICSTCGAQFGKADIVEVCPICDDDRQWVPSSGQSWTSLRELSKTRRIVFQRDPSDENIQFVVTVPPVAIGQTPILVRTPSGYLMIECCAYVSVEGVQHIRDLVERSGSPFLGIAISHPHCKPI